MRGRNGTEPPGEYPAVEFLDIPPMDAALAIPPSSAHGSARDVIEHLVDRLDVEVDELRSIVAALDAGADPAA